MGTDDAPGRTLLAQEVSAYPTLAAAMADGVRLGCGMGACQRCEREVSGVVVRTCLLRTADA